MHLAWQCCLCYTVGPFPIHNLLYSINTSPAKSQRDSVQFIGTNKESVSQDCLPFFHDSNPPWSRINKMKFRRSFWTRTKLIISCTPRSPTLPWARHCRVILRGEQDTAESDSEVGRTLQSLTPLWARHCRLRSKQVIADAESNSVVSRTLQCLTLTRQRQTDSTANIFLDIKIALQSGL